MAVEYEWYDQEKMIVMCRISGDWIWDEFYIARQAFREKHNTQALDRVDIILQFSADAGIPPNFLSTLLSAVKSAAKNWNLTVVLQPSLYVRELFRTLGMSTPEIGARYPFAESMEEALRIIYEHRAGIVKTE